MKILIDEKGNTLKLPELKNNNSQVFIISGLPGSGKSTLVKELKELLGSSNSRIVSYDETRANLGFTDNFNREASIKIRDEVVKIASELYSSGYTVIIDGVNYSSKTKRMYKRAFKNAKVTILDNLLPLNETLNRNSQRDKSVPESTVKGCMESYFVPKTEGKKKECDGFFFVVDDNISDYDENVLPEISHRNIHHLEPLSTHSKCVEIAVKMDEDIEDNIRNILLDTAKWHDLGKKFTMSPMYSGMSYKKHANVSGYIYLSNNLKESNTVEENLHVLSVAKIILLHMFKDEELDSYSDMEFFGPNAVTLTKKFEVYDREGSLESSMHTIKVEGTKYRKITTDEKYASPVILPINILQFVTKFDLSEEETLSIVETAFYFESLRASIFDEKGNRLSYGLPKFYNVGQFKDFLENLIDTSEIEYKYSNLIIDIFTKISSYEIGNNVSMLPKLDGSLILIFNINGEKFLMTRGSGTIHPIDNNFCSIESLPKYLLKTDLTLEEFNDALYEWRKDVLELPEGQTLAFEFISKLSRIVVKYKDNARFIPIARLQSGDGYYGYKVDLVQRDIDSERELLDEGTDVVEGMVIKTPEGILMKQKTDEYFAMHYKTPYDMVIKYISDEDERDDIISNISKEEIDFLVQVDSALEKGFNTVLERDEFFEKHGKEAVYRTPELRKHLDSFKESMDEIGFEDRNMTYSDFKDILKRKYFQREPDIGYNQQSKEEHKCNTAVSILKKVVKKIREED